MTHPSFDVSLKDGRTITAELFQRDQWAMFLFSADGEALDRIGCKGGSRTQAMAHAEKLARAIELDEVVV